MNKSAVVYVLLALLLGLFGIHNFYAGYWEKGLVQLIVTLIGSMLFFLVVPLLLLVAIEVWVIVEICTVNKDVKGMFFI